MGGSSQARAADGRDQHASTARVESVSRALRVLRTFRIDRPELGVSEIARELGIHKSTVHRLLATLEAEGFVHQDGDNRYALGWRAFELGAAVPVWQAIRQPVLRVLEELVATTGETAHVAILDEGEVLYIEKVESPRSLRMPSSVGKRVPLHCTALGKVLLAGLGDDELDEFVTTCDFVAFTSNTVTTPEDLLKEVQGARKSGFATDNEEIEEGLMCVGAPVLDPTGSTCAAISISGPSSRIHPRLDDHVAAVRKAGKTMSWEIGANASRLREAGSPHPR